VLMGFIVTLTEDVSSSGDLSRDAACRVSSFDGFCSTG